MMYKEVMRDYNRASWFQAKGDPDFISIFYGDAETGYDVAEASKKWLKERGYEQLSVAEAWLLEGRGGVAKATIFLSHVQVQPLEHTLAANETLACGAYVQDLSEEDKQRLGPPSRGWPTAD